jgi:hypothetical protein
MRCKKNVTIHVTITPQIHPLLLGKHEQREIGDRNYEARMSLRTIFRQLDCRMLTK